MVLSVPVTQARHWCTRYKPGQDELPEKIWCDTGCCGHGNETHCCLIKLVFEHETNLKLFTSM